MKKVGIITIFNSNYGNRLQNYALQEVTKKLGFDVYTIKNVAFLNKKTSFLNYLLRKIKFLFVKYDFVDDYRREKYFKKFNENIKFSKKYFNWFDQDKVISFDFLLVGSDQVWNPNIGRLSDFDLANFNNINKCNKISYAASIGVDRLDNDALNRLLDSLNSFSKISLREESGKNIFKDSNLYDMVEIHVDPTMLLTKEDWLNVAKKPDIFQGEKYILNYFLGDIDEEINKEINRVAAENDLKIINILDKNDPYYFTGPSEFIWLEANAEYIFTDSFHSSVFAFLFNKPFVVFNRNGFGNSMGSRLDTLLSKFELKNRRYNGKKITKDNLEHDYTDAYNILKEERKKSDEFLRKALDIKENNKGSINDGR